METVKVKATPRPQSGKGPARRLRVQDQIPAVLYGKGMDTLSISVSPKALSEALASEFGPNRIIELELAGDAVHKTLVAEYQYHPVTRRIIHADFKKIDDQSLVTVNVPLRLIGKAKGLVLGGTQRQVFRTLPVRCLPADIPAVVECDVSNLGIEETVSVRDVILPAGVQVAYPPAQTIGGVYGNRRRDEEADAADGAAKPEAAGDAKKAEAKKPEAKKADKK
jgi:large subunit ribosomal protein L25